MQGVAARRCGTTATVHEGTYRACASMDRSYTQQRPCRRLLFVYSVALDQVVQSSVRQGLVRHRVGQKERVSDFVPAGQMTWSMLAGPMSCRTLTPFDIDQDAEVFVLPDGRDVRSSVLALCDSTAATTCRPGKTRSALTGLQDRLSCQCAF